MNNQKFTKNILLIIFLLIAQFNFSQNSDLKIDGELKKWHKVTLSFS